MQIRLIDSFTDEQLLALVKKGNQAAFGQLVKKYEGVVAATIRGMLGNSPEVKDVGQEVFIRVYKNIHQFKGDASFKTWITRIAINLSLNELKKRKRLFSRFITTDDTVKFEKNIITQDVQDIKEMVQKGIGELDVKFRSVLVLRLIQGYSTKETAAILEIPQGTVLSRLNTAQKKLKDVLIKMNPNL